jgi:hypothetical protein
VSNYRLLGASCFSGTSSTNKTDCLYITEILLKVVFNITTLTLIFKREIEYVYNRLSLDSPENDLRF